MLISTCWLVKRLVVNVCTCSKEVGCRAAGLWVNEEVVTSWSEFPGFCELNSARASADKENKTCVSKTHRRVTAYVSTTVILPISLLAPPVEQRSFMLSLYVVCLFMFVFCPQRSSKTTVGFKAETDTE